MDASICVLWFDGSKTLCQYLQILLTGIASKILHFDHEAFEKIYQLLLYVRRIKQQMNGSTKYLIDPPQEHGSWSGRYSLFIRNSGRILSNL